MRAVSYLLVLLLLPALLYAVGTKKKKQTIHVRREFVGALQAAPPVEFHNDSNTYHSLRCKGSGLEKCTWRMSPPWGNTNYPLNQVDEMVLRAVRLMGGVVTPQGKPATIMLNNEITIHYWRLPNGYEYTVENVAYLTPEMDSLQQVIEQRQKVKGRSTISVQF